MPTARVHTVGPCAACPGRSMTPGGVQSGSESGSEAASSSAGSHGTASGDGAAVAVQQHARKRSNKRHRASKKSIASSAPLSTGLTPLRVRRSRSDPAGAAAALWLRECQALYARLPKASRYAQHKLRVLEEAMALLRRRSADRSAAEAAELSRLLGVLGIGSRSSNGRGSTAMEEQ
jgi:hypothetical protein